MKARFIDSDYKKVPSKKTGYKKLTRKGIKHQNKTANNISKFNVQVRKRK